MATTVAAATAAAAPQQFLSLYVDDDEKKRLEKKRRKQRQSQGYVAKRKNLGKKPTVVKLEHLKSWNLYLRAMLVAAYRKVEHEWPGDEEADDEDDATQPEEEERPQAKSPSPREEALSTILCCCPPNRELQKDKLLNTKVTKILEEEFGAIFDVARRSFDGDKIEPALFAKATALLQKLKDYFPEKMKDLAGTPYDGHKVNVCGEALDKLLVEMKHAVKFGHLGATVEREIER